MNDLLDKILTGKTLKSKSQKDDDDNENDRTLMSLKDENENENNNENDKTLMSSKDGDETITKNNSDIIEQLNDCLDEIIDKSKSIEEQKKLIRKVENLNEYYFSDDHGGKESKFKYFKLKLAHLSNTIDKKIFKQIFGETLETLANKLINTTNKEEKKTIVKNINENKEKLYEQEETRPFYDYVIQPNNRRINLIEAIDLILDFNETI